MKKGFVGLRVLIATLIFGAWTVSAGDVDLPSLDRYYDQCSWLATHNSYANPDEGFDIGPASNQPNSITAQLDYGVRIINLDLWLVRQRKVVNRLGVCTWEFEEYPGTNTIARDSAFANLPLEVVVAHGDDGKLYPALRQGCTPWKKARDVLDEIGGWVERHPNDVITIIFETKIHGDYEDSHINPAINESGIASHIFHLHLSKKNPAVPAPGGRPGGWEVEKYGYPTLRQLVQAGKTVVLYPPYLPDRASDDDWHLESQTVYGDECLDDNQQHWIRSRSESAAMNDFTRRLCSIVHVPNLPVGPYTGRDGINSILVFRDKWSDFRDYYNRLPTAVWVDYYERGFNGIGNPDAPPGPALFVHELNEIWRSLPTITAMARISPAPSADGWHRTNVLVTLSGSGDRIQAIPSRLFGATNSTLANKESYLLQNEGVTTVSFWAVGDLGKRSANRLLDVKIDRSPPVIQAFARPSMLWPANGKLKPVVVSGIIADAGSGVNPDTVVFCVKDEYRRVQPSGDIALREDGSFSFTVALEARRSGQDMSGRCYSIRLNAADRAGNAAQTLLTITVPHDRGRAPSR